MYIHVYSKLSASVRHLICNAHWIAAGYCHLPEFPTFADPFDPVGVAGCYVTETNHDSIIDTRLNLYEYKRVLRDLAGLNPLILMKKFPSN